MFKYLVVGALLATNLIANNNLVMVFDISKGKKSLGQYEISLEPKSITTVSSGVSDKVKYFFDKQIKYIKNGHKQIVFTKNQKKESFEIKTKLSIIDETTRKEYDRKLKKVKNNDMLFITKTGKKRVELFNKRKVVIRTLDEVLADIVNKKVSYDKFILFDKFGIMKMIAKIEKQEDKYIIFNRSKNDKKYIAIETNKNIPTKVTSLVSNWKMTLVKKGRYKEFELSIVKSFQNNLEYIFGDKLKDAKFKFSSKLKTTKKYYTFKADMDYLLNSDFSSKKDYEKASACKKILKDSKIKYKKIYIKNNSCSTQLTIKLDRKKYNKQMLHGLYTKYTELKKSKKIKITKSTVNYKLLKEVK